MIKQILVLATSLAAGGINTGLAQAMEQEPVSERLAPAAPHLTQPPAPEVLPGALTLLGITGLSDAGSTLARPFEDPIELILRHSTGAGRQSPPDCGSLLDVKDNITGTAAASDWNTLQQRLADCAILQALTRAIAPERSALPASPWTERRTRFWPAALWPAISKDEILASARPGQTLQSVSGVKWWQAAQPGTAKPPSLQLNSQGYTLRIQFLAHGDFDSDGWEDWLVRWQAWANEGSWRAARALLITRSAGQRTFVVRPITQLPPPK